MARKKKQLSKTAEYRQRYSKAMLGFKEAQSKCINKGIHICVECLVEKTKWRIIIYFYNKAGDLLDVQESDKPKDFNKDGKFYFSKEEYELAVLELHQFYAKR